MNIVCDTSFLMILCYEPIKNMNFLEHKFGKPVFLIHPLIVKELMQIKQKGHVKRSKIANLALEIISKEIINKNFKYIENEISNDLYEVDSQLLKLSLKNKYPLATIDKNLIKRALEKGSDIITLKNNKLIYLYSKIKSEQI